MAQHKIMVLGDPKTGKSSLTRCCLGLDEHTRTRTVDGFEVVEMAYNDCVMEVWDLQEPLYYDQIPTSLLEDLQGVVIVYDIGRLATFHNLPNWLDRLAGPNPIPVVVVGNKVDLRQWSADVVKSKDGSELVTQLSQLYGRDIPYFEVSSYRGKMTRRISERLMGLVCAEFDGIRLTT